MDIKDAFTQAEPNESIAEFSKAQVRIIMELAAEGCRDKIDLLTEENARLKIENARLVE